MLRKNISVILITKCIFQIFVSVTFVTCCQCQRLWPKPPAGNYHKIFLVLYSFLFGIQSLCGIEVFNMLHFKDAEAAITLISVTTPILSCVILRYMRKNTYFSMVLKKIFNVFFYNLGSQYECGN